jgi:hypothetical protein
MFIDHRFDIASQLHAATGIVQQATCSHIHLRHVNRLQQLAHCIRLLLRETVFKYA